MNKFIFIGSLIPPDMSESVNQNIHERNSMVEAANSLQWAIINGIEANTEQSVAVLCTLPVFSYPNNYKKAFIGAHQFSHVPKAEDFLAGYCNISGIKQLSVKMCLAKPLLSKIKGSDELPIVFIYALTPVNLYAVMKAKKKFPNLKVICIVADLPDFISLAKNGNPLIEIYQRHISKTMYQQLQYIDGFILLTKYMADYMKLSQPYLVMEGISTKCEVKSGDFNTQNDDSKTILYTGTLHERFGILQLIKAFESIQQPNYRLIICGTGDSVDKVKSAAQKDSRIWYKGVLPRQEVLNMQHNATVLVNPRSNDEEFTKYSFPSKNLEYLSSGVPLVAYKLDGIPDEYDKYIHYVNGTGIEALAQAMIKVCEMPEQKRQALGKQAQEYVFTNKTSAAQGKRIINFIKDNIK